jgi:DNA-binding CsgD family transcriptional regulator
MRNASTLNSSVVKSLARKGHLDEALRALTLLEAEDSDADGSVRSLRDWVSCWYPDLVGSSSLRVHSPVTSACGGLEAFRDLMLTQAGDRAVLRAEEVLGSCPMSENALESLTAALAALIYSDRADRAARWCAPLLEQTTAHCDPVWLGLFAAIRAETAFRRGELESAVKCVRTALAHISWQSWGVAIGIPFATMISVKTAMGLHEDVARYLAVPVPEAMFETPAGLHYLSARGHFQLSSGDAGSALADFLECGDRMRRWKIDLPGLVPWRIGAGRARLALGQRAEAGALAEEQLDLLGQSRTRTRGMALRLKAVAGLPRGRALLLEQAVEVLEESGDGLELAGALEDLAVVHVASGDQVRARALRSRAEELSGTAGVPARSQPVAAAPALVRPSMVLSEAEVKVATLAAQGMSNRQISSQLYVTVSTVEQHLTRIYRKLRVSRRVDLAEFV